MRFLGYLPNPENYMQAANVFVLSSRYEGFPNVVLEAMSYGTTVVAFDCPGGTSEIIENGRNGWLVEPGNVKELSESIKNAIAYPLDPIAIKKSVSDRYSIKKIIKLYERLFEYIEEY